MENLFDNLEITEDVFVGAADDSRWDDENWVTEQAELSAMNDQVDKGVQIS